MSKELKASVRLDTKSAVRSLDQLEKKIKRIDTLVNKTSNSGNKFGSAVQKATKNVRQLDSANNKAANSASKIAKGYQKTNSAVSVLTKNLRTLVSTYVGLMGAKAVLNTSDVITSAENKLNYLSGGDTSATQSTMDKTYAAAQRSRGSYTDMIGNVSKSMTLAGDAFQGDVDNAIRFQEIMSKAYTVGGASAAEQSSSMYQMIQALGSGVLQGDELRSVREGAPLAYKAIEEFAQGVLKTDESLKELASDGKITSDMVVAAVMNMGDSIDQAFEKTDMTFAQALDNIKNMATKAFEPVLQKLNDALQSAADSGVLDAIGQVFVLLANTILWVMGILERFFNWCADNWYWLKWIVYSVVTAITVALGIMAAKAVWAGLMSFWAFITGLSPLYIWIIVIGLVVAALVWMANSASSACEFIYNICMILAQAIIGVLMVVLAVYIATGTVMLSIPVLIGLLILGVLAIVVAAFVKYTGEICGVAYGVYSVIQAICTNIGVAWQNMCAGMSQWFWNAIADMLDSCDWLLKGINKAREALGKDPIDIGSIRAKAEAAGAGGGQSYVDVGDAWSTGYAKGYAKGEAIQSDINAWGDKLKGLLNNFNFGELTGVDGNANLGNYAGGSYLPDAYDPAYGVDGGYDPNKALKGIADDTGSIADSMELTAEDLEYLRKVADMEWKKEFTTATIQVDMSNYNTVNGESDLDGIVTALSDKLYEELNAVANGVYA